MIISNFNKPEVAEMKSVILKGLLHIILHLTAIIIFANLCLKLERKRLVDTKGLDSNLSLYKFVLFMYPGPISIFPILFKLRKYHSYLLLIASAVFGLLWFMTIVYFFEFAHALKITIENLLPTEFKNSSEENDGFFSNLNSLFSLPEDNSSTQEEVSNPPSENKKNANE